jgi:hypothetical protein
MTEEGEIEPDTDRVPNLRHLRIATPAGNPCASGADNGSES